MSAQYLHAMRESLIRSVNQGMDLLKENLPHLPDEGIELAGRVLSRRPFALARLEKPEGGEIGGLRTRIHGDYHLGQVLRAKEDFVILDFEGEPARPLEERRAKHSPLKDVAGMLRSFSYAASSGLISRLLQHPHDSERLEPWSRLWEQSAASAFLHSYREGVKGAAVAPDDPAQFDRLLEFYLLEKVFYELVYELNHRPGWVRIPLRGILALLA